jgi:putative IMPACT (imprinted ancient) family translation regulator
MKKEDYLTIAQDGLFELEIKKSKFLTHLKRVESEEYARIKPEAPSFVPPK